MDYTSTSLILCKCQENEYVTDVPSPNHLPKTLSCVGACLHQPCTQHWQSLNELTHQHESAESFLSHYPLLYYLQLLLVQQLDHRHDLGNKCRQPQKQPCQQIIRRAIVRKPNLRQHDFSVLLFIAINIAQHISQSLIDHFCLYISVGMGSTTKLQLCPEHISQIKLKLADELCIHVRSNSLWNTMQMHHFLKENMCHKKSIFSLLASNKMRYL